LFFPASYFVFQACLFHLGCPLAVMGVLGELLGGGQLFVERLALEGDRFELAPQGTCFLVAVLKYQEAFNLREHQGGFLFGL
jgi:hypothetical protein